MSGGLIKMIKPISVFTEVDHGETEHWRDYLIHPIRSYWGDGTAEWEKWKLDFEFYKNILFYLKRATKI